MSAQSNLSLTVASAGRRLKWSAVLNGLCWWLAVCLGLWLGLFALDNLLSLPAGLRLPLAVGGVVFTGLHFFRRVLRVALRRQTPERTAVLLEQRYGIRENLLINGLQFQRQDLRPEELPFAQQTIAASEDLSERVRVDELWDWRRLRVWAGAAAAVLCLWAAFIFVFPRQFNAASARYLKPLGDVPPPGRVALKLTPSTDVTLAEGENLDVAVEVQGPAGAAPTAAPLIVWQEKTGFVPPGKGGGETALMTARADAPATSLHTFANVQRSFAFRVFAGDSFTRSVAVKVLPTPRLKEPTFRITPPTYTGLKTQVSPGPPTPLAVLPGSGVEISFALDTPVRAATWTDAGRTIQFTSGGGRWQAQTVITNSGAYEIAATVDAGARPVTLARGEVQLLSDGPPEVDFVTEDRNRVVQFGQTLQLVVAARDDLGLASLEVVARPVEKEMAGASVKRWTYLGPPGNPGPVRETLELTIRPGAFEAGASYYLEALARDYRPGGGPSRSRPIVLRIKSQDDMTLPEGDPLAPAFAALKSTVVAQEKANSLTANLRTYLDEVLQKHKLGDQSLSLRAQQAETQRRGQEATRLFRDQAEGVGFATALENITRDDMPPVLEAFKKLDASAGRELGAALSQIASEQDRILAALLNLLGRVADARGDKLKSTADGKDIPQPPAVTQEERTRELLDGLKDFIAAQERVLEKSRTLADKGPEDLTQEEKENLGELAREEEKWAKFLEEKLTDFSKLPQQDFADASQAQEFNAVFQEVQLAADALTQKKIELAVPHEQSGLENAKSLENNLERWLPDAPDNLKWNMEEPLAPTDVALAELPKELEDIVGELLDKEDQMTTEVEDVTSSWMDSLDKGAGWGAGDGPISDMSARGVTGNQLPNKNEVGGRSGEGRTGKSHGQMVSDTAEGKGGRETPTRLTPEPFEQGSVKDTAKSDEGGATGGGKLSDFAGEGLRGPPPPPSNQKMPRLAEQQAKIRQEAEALALKLRRYRVPSGALETSINAMSAMEQAARKNDGLAVRRAFNGAVDALGETKKNVAAHAAVRREQNKLPSWQRDEMRTGVQDGVPKGYEEMVGEYFRALAEGRTK